MKGTRGQGAFEYVLLLAGVIMVVILTTLILRGGILGAANQQIGQSTNAYSQLTTIPPLNDLVFLAHMNGDANAAGGEAPTAIANGGPSFSSGHFGQAAVFNGSTRLEYGNTGRSPTKEVTMAAWVRIDNLTASDYHTLVTKEGLTVNYERSYYMGIANATNQGAVVVAYYNATHGNVYIYTAPGTIQQGAWYHIAGVINVNEGKLHTYINGNEVPYNISSVANGSTSGDMPNGDWPVKVGSGKNATAGNTRPTYGAIDDVAIYDRALSADEIQRIYRATMEIPG